MSRLDRLFTLLSSSSSASTSTLAAEQLGEVQKSHPEQIHVLLSRLHPLFRSNKWEVRISASKALIQVLKHLPAPVSPVKQEGDRKWMDKFDLERILTLGRSALADQSTKDEDESALDIETQKKNLKSALGLPFDQGKSEVSFQKTRNEAKYKTFYIDKDGDFCLLIT